MKKCFGPLILLGALAACAAPDSGPSSITSPGAQMSSVSSQGKNDDNQGDDGPADAKVHHVKDWVEQAKPTGQARSAPNMTYHGGKIMTTANIKAIFWGTSWASSAGDKVTGMDSFYSGWNNTIFARTNIEYTGSNGTAGASSAYSGHVFDPTAASGGGSTSAILAAVCRNITTPDASGNGYYPVYTDVPRGNAGYCAWHSAGSCGGKPVQFAFYFKLDGDSGCDPVDASGLHSQGLAAIANVSAHELSEALTDPASPGAWYDSQGYENADKCAWVFNATSLQSFSNGSQWKVQGNWSNRAYNAGTGYANRSGQKGCINQYP